MNLNEVENSDAKEEDISLEQRYFVDTTSCCKLGFVHRLCRLCLILKFSLLDTITKD